MDALNHPSGDATQIQVTNHTDSICSPCPHRTDKTCTSQKKIDRLDDAHAKALAIQTDDVLTWSEAKSRIAEKISLDIFHQICAGCEWKKYGMCEEVLKKLDRKI